MQGPDKYPNINPSEIRTQGLEKQKKNKIEEEEEKERRRKLGKNKKKAQKRVIQDEEDLEEINLGSFGTGIAQENPDEEKDWRQYVEPATKPKETQNTDETFKKLFENLTDLAGEYWKKQKLAEDWLNFEKTQKLRFFEKLTNNGTIPLSIPLGGTLSQKNNIEEIAALIVEAQEHGYLIQNQEYDKKSDIIKISFIPTKKPDPEIPQPQSDEKQEAPEPEVSSTPEPPSKQAPDKNKKTTASEHIKVVENFFTDWPTLKKLSAFYFKGLDIKQERKHILENIEKGFKDNPLKLKYKPNEIFYHNQVSTSIQQELAAYILTARYNGYDIKAIDILDKENEIWLDIIKVQKQNTTENTTNKENKEEEFFTMVPKKILKAAINSAKTFAMNQPGSSDKYRGIFELADLDPNNNLVETRLLIEFVDNMEQRFGGPRDPEEEKEEGGGPEYDSSYYDPLTALQGWFENTKGGKMGKLLKDIEKIRYIPDMFVTLEEKFVKDQSKEAEKNKENKEIFEKAVSGTILLALEQVGNWFSDTYLSLFVNFLNLAFYNPLEKGAKMKWHTPDWWPSWLGGSKKNDKK